MPFPARFAGRCGAECGRPIKPGDSVTYDDDQIVHEDCVGREQRPKTVCTACWTEKPCFCEE